MDVPRRRSKGVERSTRQDSTRSDTALRSSGSDVRSLVARRRFRTPHLPSPPVESASAENSTHAYSGDDSECDGKARAVKTSMRRRRSSNGRETAGQGSGHAGMLDQDPYRSRTASRQLMECHAPRARLNLHHTCRTGKIRSGDIATWITNFARSLLRCHMLTSTRRRSPCRRVVCRT
jgi:hypothetical protein